MFHLYEYKIATNLGKLYLLPKIHNRLSNVPGRPVILNCGTPTEKAFENTEKSYWITRLSLLCRKANLTSDSEDFIKKIENRRFDFGDTRCTRVISQHSA